MFDIGQRVHHDKFGEGTIMDFEDDIYWVLFDGFCEQTEPIKLKFKELESL